ncbi:MAG: hypothetical protein ABIH77_01430 [Pseudomonadota bacterium]|nr:hypothetical protein [Gammaproteobacteria bacterium]MBU1559185.1 hypothetical protein [Gammaproteobacteria bacterium]MBU1629346.1 hypothetical protein [Gammaproteobacteria bacterium]MBU1926765.1 hypothetical protein [Gammaproteobacteria bacterium]MBU2546257.1 hypothetical protein [Gammaproteobacteria bacterium]
MLHPFIFETVMLLCFGAAWPFSIYKSYVSQSNQGKSLYFLIVIFFGYLNGIIFQLIIAPQKHLALGVFMLNTTMVLIDILLYIRNAWVVAKD